MSNPTTNFEPITFEEFAYRISKNSYKVKGYYSIYLTPYGDILDCRQPQDLGHNDFSRNVFDHLEELPVNPYNSNLRGLGIPFDEVSYYLMDYFNLLDVMYEDTELYTKIDKIILGSEDRICQDMGFIKLAINTKLKTFELVLPNPIFKKKATGAQKDIISKLSTLFNMNIDERLKSEQTDNMQLAMQIEEILNKLKKTTP